MGFKKYLDIYNEMADTSNTTFFHEVCTGILIVDPGATSKLKSGADVLKYIKNNQVIPVRVGGGADGVTPIDDITELKQARFFSKDVKIPQKILSDASSIAIKFREKAKPGTVKKVWWTGPTNDASKWGAADIVVVSSKGKFPVSLKFGVGQLKNLSINTVGEVLGIAASGKNVVDDIETTYAAVFNRYTKKWIEYLQSFSYEKYGNDSMNIVIDETINIQTWDEYQKSNLQNPEKAYRSINVKYKKTSAYNRLRKFCAKIYENANNVDKAEWTGKIRKEFYEKTLGAFFKTQEAKFKKNVKKLFEVQLSVQEEDYWYAAKGGKDLKLIPGKKTFEEGIKNLKVEYSFEESGTGYIIPLKVSTKKNELLLEIKIIFRWKFGEMVGSWDTASVKKEYVEDWTEYFV